MMNQGCTRRVDDGRIEKGRQGARIRTDGPDGENGEVDDFKGKKLLVYFYPKAGTSG